MTSEIRVNKIENRSGLGTVTFADTGVDLAGIVTATTFSGSGASLTNLPATSLTGTVADARFPATLPAASAANLTNVPAANITGTLPAISAANLTNIPAANVTGTLPSLTAENLTSIPAANIVGLATAGFERSGGFGGRKYTYGSWVTTSSGTEIAFTSIADTTQFAIDWLNVSAAANQEQQTTIGDSGGYETSGYQTATGYAGSGGNHHDPSANLWKTEGNANAAGQTTGRMHFINLYGNWWYMEFFYLDTGGSPYFKYIYGHKELSGQLDRVKFDWDGGTSFDGGYMRYVKIEDF